MIICLVLLAFVLLASCTMVLISAGRVSSFRLFWQRNSHPWLSRINYDNWPPTANLWVQSVRNYLNQFSMYPWYPFLPRSTSARWSDLLYQKLQINPTSAKRSQGLCLHSDRGCQLKLAESSLSYSLVWSPTEKGLKQMSYQRNVELIYYYSLNHFVKRGQVRDHLIIGHIIFSVVTFKKCSSSERLRECALR